MGSWASRLLQASELMAIRARGQSLERRRAGGGHRGGSRQISECIPEAAGHVELGLCWQPVGRRRVRGRPSTCWACAWGSERLPTCLSSHTNGSWSRPLSSKPSVFPQGRLEKGNTIVIVPPVEQEVGPRRAVGSGRQDGRSAWGTSNLPEATRTQSGGQRCVADGCFKIQALNM